jgi:hypothetical protein
VTGLTLALVARSGRWLAPALVYLVWLVLVLANPGPPLGNAANMFFAVALFATWFAVLTGNCDDDPHRDLCAAAVGSPARLQVARTALGFAVTAVVVAATAPLTVAAGDADGHGTAYDLAVTLALLVGAALAGTATGAFLHRPLVRNVGWAVVVAAAVLIAGALLPPVQHVLRSYDRSQAGSVAVLVAVTAALAAGATAASAWLVRRSS